MPIVIDTSALVALPAIARIDLLRETAGEVFVPDPVYREIVTQGEGWGNAREARERLMSGQGRRRVTVKMSNRDTIAPNLGAGERETLAAALEHGWDVAIDDLRGRKAAVSLGIESRLIGSLWVLIRAKRMGLVREVAPLIHGIRTRRIYYHPDLVEKVLREVDE